MKRSRIKARKLGVSNGESFELTAIGFKEQERNKARRDQERQHKLLRMGRQEERENNARKAAENAIDFILSNQKPYSPQKMQV